MKNVFLLFMVFGLAGCGQNPGTAPPAKQYAQISGIPGFQLGEKLAAKYLVEKGSYFDDEFTNLPPFGRLMVSVDSNRMIYSVYLDTHADFNVPYDVQSEVKTMLTEKYGNPQVVRDSDRRVFTFKNGRRSAELVFSSFKGNDQMRLTYWDHELLSADMASEREKTKDFVRKKLGDL